MRLSHTDCLVCSRWGGHNLCGTLAELMGPNVNHTQTALLEWRAWSWACCSLPTDTFTDAPAFSTPTGRCCISPVVLSVNWLLMVCRVWSASLQRCTSVFAFWFHLLVFLFLKLHQGTRTHAQTPRRPVPPPKPRRSKKGVSLCRLQPSTSTLLSALLTL